MPKARADHAARAFDCVVIDLSAASAAATVTLAAGRTRP
jgi:hypothetical protein